MNTKNSRFNINTMISMFSNYFIDCRIYNGLMRILKLSLFTAFCIFTVNSCNNFALSTHDHGWFDGVIENEVDGRYHLLGTAKPGDALFTTPTPVTFWLEQSHTSLIKDSHPVGSDLKFYFHVLAFPTSGADAEVQIVTMD